MARELWRLYLSEFLIVGCVLLPAAGGVWAFLMFLVLLECRGHFELYDLLDRRLTTGTSLLALASGTALIVIASVAPQYLAPSAVVSVVLVLTVASARSGLPDALTAVLSLVFPASMLAACALVRSRPQGFEWILFAYGTVEMNDAFALLFGKLIGRHHVLPNLSPNKTLEGTAGGLIFGGLTGYAIARLLLGISAWLSIGFVAVVLVAGLAGDISCSALKRWRRRKDFDPIAATHGGVLDIYDSFLFAVPAALLLRAATGF